MSPTARLDSQFYPRESHGTKVFENTNTPCSVRNFTATTPVANPFPSYQGANCTKLQRLKLDFTYKDIIQHLKPLLYEDSVSKLSTDKPCSKSISPINRETSFERELKRIKVIKLSDKIAIAKYELSNTLIDRILANT